MVPLLAMVADRRQWQAPLQEAARAQTSNGKSESAPAAVRFVGDNQTVKPCLFDRFASP